MRNRYGEHTSRADATAILQQNCGIGFAACRGDVRSVARNRHGKGAATMFRTATFSSAGLVAVALLAVGCKDSVSPGARSPGRPEFWGGGQQTLHLAFTQQPASGKQVGCTALADLGLSTISVAVSVVDDLGNPVDAFVTIAIAHNAGAAGAGQVCNPANGTASPSVTVQAVAGVAHFDLGIDLPSVPLESYTLRASAANAADIVSGPFCVGLCAV